MKEGSGTAEMSKELIPRSISTQNRLVRRKEELEKELKSINDAMELFSKYPEIADALDLLGQIRI